MYLSSFHPICWSFEACTFPDSKYWAVVSTANRPLLSVGVTIISPLLILLFSVFRPSLSLNDRLR